jgi:hypothetical protein
MARPVAVDLAFLRDPRRVAAILVIALVGAAMAIWLIVRGELVGADARAYWGGVRLWLEGRDLLDPPAPYLPYVYVPWSVPLFWPWAAMPWEAAWFTWRAANVLLLAWSAAWAYRRRPLATALLLTVLLVPLTATLDTGNITLLCALAPWLAVMVGPRVGGLAWAVAAALKWFPIALLVVLPARARRWGVGALVVAAILSLAVWPATLPQLELAIGFPRPLRIDYLLLLWGAVPWLWARDAWFEPRAWPARARGYLLGALAALRGWWQGPDRPAVAGAAAGRGVRWLLGIG